MNDCPHYNSGLCGIASSLAEIPASTNNEACNHCSDCEYPRQPNWVTSSLAGSAARKAGTLDSVQVRFDLYREIGVPPEFSNEFGHGPGTVLKELFLSIDIIPKFDCDCESLLREMNKLGVEGCRRERERLVAGLKLNAHHYTWIDRIRAAQRIAQSELVLRIDITDPIGWLFDEAVRRYEVIELGAKKDA